MQKWDLDNQRQKEPGLTKRDRESLAFKCWPNMKQIEASLSEIEFSQSVSSTPVFNVYNFQKYRLGQPNWEYTMWKFQDFSAPQILHEINFGHFEARKLLF